MEPSIAPASTGASQRAWCVNGLSRGKRRLKRGACMNFTYLVCLLTGQLMKICVLANYISFSEESESLWILLFNMPLPQRKG